MNARMSIRVPLAELIVNRLVKNLAYKEFEDSGLAGIDELVFIECDFTKTAVPIPGEDGLQSLVLESDDTALYGTFVVTGPSCPNNVILQFLMCNGISFNAVACEDLGG